jgi:hypothetical protein
LGGVPIPTRGIHCGTLYMYVLCDVGAKLLSVIPITLKISILVETSEHSYCTVMISLYCIIIYMYYTD